MPLPIIAGGVIAGICAATLPFVIKCAVGVITFNAIPNWAWAMAGIYLLGGRKVIEESGGFVVKKITTLGFDVIKIVINGTEKYIIPQTAKSIKDICAIVADNLEGVHNLIKFGNINKVDNETFNERMQSLKRLSSYNERAKEIEEYYNNLNKKYGITFKENEAIDVKLSNDDYWTQIENKYLN